MDGLTDWSEYEYQYNGPYDKTSVPVMDRGVIQRDSQEQKDDHLCNITAVETSGGGSTTNTVIHNYSDRLRHAIRWKNNFLH